MSLVRLATLEDLPDIQALMDEPSVTEGALLAREPGLTAETLFNASKMILMAKGGAFALAYLSPFQLDAHTMFRPAYRGRHAYRAAREALEIIFTTTDTLEVFTQVHKDNRPVQMFTGSVGFTRIFEEGEFVYYHLTLSDWLASANGLGSDSLLSGSPTPFQAKLAGFAVKCFQAGLLFRGVGTYNVWAARMGWPLFTILSTDPTRVDLGGCIVSIREGLVEVETQEVAPCQW